jgi:hypothetical protein
MKKLCGSIALALLVLSLAPLETFAQWVGTNGPSGATTALTFSGPTLIAGTAGGGAFIAAGGFSSWSASNSGLTDPDLLSLSTTVNEFGTEVVLAGTQGGGAFASWNQGASWSAASTGLTSTTVPAVIGVADSYFGLGMVLFAGTEGGGVFRSNGGANIIWVPRNGGMTSPLLQSFVSIPGGDENDGIGARDLIAGTDAGAFLSTDGVTWLAKNTGLTNLDVLALAATSTGAFEWTLFAATPGGVFRSTSLYGNWSAAGTGLPGGVKTLLGVGSRLFAGTSGGGLFLSTDQGASWGAVSAGLPVVAVNALASNGTQLFAGTASGVYRRPLSEFDGTTAVGAAAAAAFVGVPYPNPFATSLAVSYRLDAAGPVRITVHDVQGRRVAELFAGERPAGEHQARWDGRSESGSAAGAGVYYLRLEAAGRVGLRRIVLAR